MRCLERDGVHNTSIADIVAESGLSTGAIYSHFSTKAEIARFIVRRHLFPRVDALEAISSHGGVLRPSQVLEALLTTFTSGEVSVTLVLQFWAESTVDPELAQEVQRTVASLRSAVTRALLPWARTQTGPENAEELAGQTARTVAALAQGFAANSAIFGPWRAEDYLDSVRTALNDEQAPEDR